MPVGQFTSQNVLSGKSEPNSSSVRLLVGIHESRVLLSVLQAPNNIAVYSEQPCSCLPILVICDHLRRHCHWSKTEDFGSSDRQNKLLREGFFTT